MNMVGTAVVAFVAGVIVGLMISVSATKAEVDAGFVTFGGKVYRVELLELDP